MSRATEVEPAGGRREERKAENRAKLLAAARKVFAEKGLGAATARDIVRETDLASGTFYNYFDSKDAVFDALIEELTHKALARVRAERRRTDAPMEERVERAFLAYFELALEERELFEVLRRNIGTVTVPDESMLEAGVAELGEDLADWARAGDLPAIDIEYMATAMAGAGFQIAFHLLDRDPPDAAAAARFCAHLFLGGLERVAAG